MKKKSTRRTGRLSREDWDYIRKNVYTRTPEEMAEYLNKTATTVKEFIRKDDLVSPFLVSEADKRKRTLRLLLYNRSYWKELKKQLTEEELESFTMDWVQLMEQFNEDILPSEELQLKDYLILEILKNRSLADRKKHMDEADKLETLRDELFEESKKMKKSKGKDSDEALLLADRVAQLNEQILAIRASITSYTAEHAKFLEKGASIAKDLKSLRADRIKKIEDGKTTYSGYIKMLENERKRREEGAEVEIMREAKEKEKERLSQYHTYVDGTIDRPFLTPETVIKDEEIDE